MMIFNSVNELKKGCEGVLEVKGDQVKVLIEETLRNSLIDSLIFTAAFSALPEVKEAASWLIRKSGAALGILSSSIQSLYEAMGRKEVTGFTVPAINIRALTYEAAQAIFRAALKDSVGAVIFEIARSEIDYTKQRPIEYTSAVTAAAIKTGFRGPIFLQGDHLQVNAKKFAADAEKEVKGVKDLIWEALEAGFYNIDVDTSTLVDLSKPTIDEQQKTNFDLAAELTSVIRDLEPAGITVSVGGEIGEVGGKNSTVEELQAFMDGYLEALKGYGPELKGISKISVQTGTTHGGVPLADGSVAKVKLDFETLEKLSEVARSRYGLSGAVQHGASTLPNEAFDRFPAIGTAEIHLATGFQNIIYDSAHFPADLKDRIYEYLQREMAGEKKETDTEEQFIYKTRKKGFGPFKQELWQLPPETLKQISTELENQFTFLFRKLNVVKTEAVVRKFVSAVEVPLKAPAALKG
jgi:fructose/tagatose bisphosphate aldolase